MSLPKHLTIKTEDITKLGPSGAIIAATTRMLTHSPVLPKYEHRDGKCWTVIDTKTWRTYVDDHFSERTRQKTIQKMVKSGAIKRVATPVGYFAYRYEKEDATVRKTR